jgi:hypothetical protein
MKLRKISVVLLALLLAAMVMVPMVSAFDSSGSLQLKKTKPISEFQPSGKFQDYSNAPAITQEQKDLCRKLISTSKTLNKFEEVPKSTSNVMWVYPYTGTIRTTMIVGSEKSDTYGLYYSLIDPVNNSILEEGFVNWKEYW